MTDSQRAARRSIAAADAAALAHAEVLCICGKPLPRTKVGPFGQTMVYFCSDACKLAVELNFIDTLRAALDKIRDHSLIFGHRSKVRPLL